MADSELMKKAIEILEIPSHYTGIKNLVTHLTYNQQFHEYITAKTLYDYCVSKFPDSLAVKLLKLYESSTNTDVRFRSISLLAKTLISFRDRGFEPSASTTYQLMPILISSLRKKEPKESEFEFLRGIVSCVAYSVVKLDNSVWRELSDCILHLLSVDVTKAFKIFVDLPGNIYDFRFVENIQEKAYLMLSSPEEDKVEDWSLALQCVVKLGIQLVYRKWRSEWVDDIELNLVKSMSELVEKGMDVFLIRGLEDLERFLLQDLDLYKYNARQCYFLRMLLFKIKDLGTYVEHACVKISMGINRHVSYDNLNSFSLSDVLQIGASTDLEEWYREFAIRRFYELLSEHRSKEVKLEVSVIREFQPLLISFLEEDSIAESMLNILGKVVNHVAEEVLASGDGNWEQLMCYLAFESKRNFPRAISLYGCLSVPLEEDVFLKLLPEVSTRLETPKDLETDNGCWVPAFTTAFCAIIHLIKATTHAEFITKTAEQMVKSVKEIVERGMEVELVRNAFIEMETIVRNQMNLYGKIEYKFIKGLLWSVYQIKGMTKESKMVLWRISFRLQRGVSKEDKEIFEGETTDWLNQPMEPMVVA